MAFQTTNKSSRASISDINVTPFVDVMLVLLVIFMVTAPMMQQGLDVKLPETANTGVSLNEDPFIVVIDSKGSVKIADTAIEQNQIGSKFKALFENKKNKQIYIQADKSVDYGTVAFVMGEARSAGITNISLITLPK